MDGSTRQAEQSPNGDPDRWGSADLGSPALGGEAGWSSPMDAMSPRRRLTRLIAALEAEIIPRLAEAHGLCEAPPALPAPAAAAAELATADAQVQRLADLSYGADDDALPAAVERLRAEGRSVEHLLLAALAPAARRLGVMWEQDLCSFTDVTVGLGRMQRVMRDLSLPCLAAPEPAARSRRILLMPAPGEQHTFGLTIVAEFFRREHWDVVLELDPERGDVRRLVQDDWYDAVGMSAAHETRLDWMGQAIRELRSASRNPAVRMLVGGPLFTLHPELVAMVGADATASDGSRAPELAATLLATAPDTVVTTPA